MTMQLDDLLIEEDKLIKDALIQLDKTAKGILFVVSSEKLKGVLTDGDIRRALLSNVTLECKVKDAMNTNFTALDYKTNQSKILRALSDQIKVLPLIDKSGRVKDYATIGKLRKIPVASPNLEGNELNYVAHCIKTNWISSQGKYVHEFEEKFSNLHENRFALAVSNGTTALHLSLLALKIGVGDEVIVPDLTFAATINSVIYTGAQPVIVDVDYNSWTIDTDAIKRRITPKTKAIMPVHLYGYPCQMNEIQKIASEHGLYIIEDCAESLGSAFEGKLTGTFGDAATFSFFGNKTITTGEGGMVLFNDKSVYAYAQTLRDHGMNPDRRYWHDFIGYNYRLTNVQAAIGVAQLERLDLIIRKKKEVARIYTDALRSHPRVKTPPEHEKVDNTFWLYSIIVENINREKQQEIIETLLQYGIEARPLFYPLHQMPPYKRYSQNSETYEVSIKLSNGGISLPSDPFMSRDMQEYVIETFIKVLNNVLR